MLVQPLPVPPTANTPIIMARVNTVVINLFSVLLIALSPSYSFLLFLFSFTKIIDSILPSGIFINNSFGTNRHCLGRIDIRKAGEHHQVFLSGNFPKYSINAFSASELFFVNCISSILNKMHPQCPRKVGKQITLR